ncbi:MAG: hypothetical protein KIT83_02690 [Bryobacterales bacterium]|nr:hypothetical protein [Bryobacterales bacterium]
MELVDPDGGRIPHGIGDAPTRDAWRRGAFRHRVVLVADRSGVDVIRGTAPLPRAVADRVQQVTKEATMARFVWADSRLLEPGHAMSGLVPTRRPSMSAASLGRSSSVLAAAEPLPIWRRMLPWAAAIATAGLGFLVFLYRAA